MNSYENLIDTLLDGRYHLTGIIGIGGMAVVYEAEDLAVNKRRVAVKMLKDEIGEDEQEVKRFINESKAVAMLSHPNIVHIYDVSVNFSGEHQYIVMEYIDGITLKDYISRKGRLNWHESISYTEQILNALGHAHEKGIIHRDVKPQNIILLRNGNIKITDFGIAKIQNSEPLTMTDKAIGTVHYISPEQASGTSQITNMSDIYSVGVLMYEMTTGKLPFNGNTPIQIAMMQVNDTPQNPRIINPEIPKGLSQIILKAMNKIPERRYQSTGEMIQQLGMILANPSVVFDRNERNNTGGESNGQGQQRNNLPIVADVKKRNTSKDLEVVQKQKTDLAQNPRNKNTANGEENMRNVKSKKNRQRKNGRANRPVRRSRSMMPIISGVTLAFLIVLGVSAFTIILSFLNGAGPNDDEKLIVPNFEGKMYDDALIAELDSLRLRPNIERVYNDSYEPNTVISQKPEPDSIKKFRSSADKIDITFKLSMGKDSYELPDFSVYENRQIELQLKSKNINVEVVFRPHDTILKGYIIETDPAPGSVVNSGDTVTLYVSEGQEQKMTIMPELEKKSEKDAKRIITEYNLIYKETKMEYSDVIPYGCVISQDPQPMKSVPEKSTKVTITISLGPKPVE